MIETPSWGYGDSGTRFGVFPQPGRPRDMFEKLDDAAEVHRLTGTAPARSRCTSRGTRSTTTTRCARTIEARGLRVGAVNPNLFQDPDYKLGSVTPSRRARCARRRSRTCSSASRSPPRSARRAQSLWLADGTNYPGQDDLRERRRADARLPRRACTRELPGRAGAAASSTSSSSPRSTRTDLADWGSALLTCLKLGERAKVLVDLGHHAQGTNIEQIVAFLADEGRLGGFHFNNRKYADDDLIVGSVNPFELFLIFVELAASGALPRLTIDQSHNVEAKVEAMVLSRRQPAGGLREGAARRPRRAARGPGRPATCSAATRSCSTPSTPTSGPRAREARVALGAAENPIRALRESGYADADGHRT